MKMIEPWTVDFETEKISSRPQYPPKPVGVAIREPGGRKHYYAWGHRSDEWGAPSRNNCSVAVAASRLRDIYTSGEPVLFHNGSFDLDVGEIHLGLQKPANIEDSLFVAFLKNPHEQTIALKPLCEKYLDMPPEERDTVKDWIFENVKHNGRRIPKKFKEWGAYISNVPADIVGPYALGDVDRTFKFWRKYKPEIVRRGMYEAYRREIKLIPITHEMERSGIRINVHGLKSALYFFGELDKLIVKDIHKRLRIDPGSDFNIDSGPQLAQRLIECDKLSASTLTPTGRQSTKVNVLHDTCNDKDLLNLLSVHSVCEKYINGFMLPWLEQCEKTDGRLLPKFNQVRARTNEGGGGTRTGRYSSYDPNLQTVVANALESKNKDILLLLQKWLKDNFQYDFVGLRDFFLPDEGMLLVSVDYNQQELRLLAHFAGGELAAMYRANPDMDIHAFFQEMIRRVTGRLFERKAVKTLVFGLIYGMGVSKLAAGIGQPVNVAQQMKNALLEAVPGIKNLIRQLKILEDMDLPLRTWGGREYYCEPPYTMPNGQVINFGYKMLNQLIQPSAADVTKQGMIQVVERVPQVRVALQVHDEIVAMIPRRKHGEEIKNALCDMKFNVPMTCDAKYSEISWARVEKENV